MQAGEILKVTGGRLLSGDPAAIIRADRITTDSRQVVRGSLFIALKGDKFDGNSFAGQALRKGAMGVVVSGPASLAHTAKDLVIKVDDTLKALQAIAVRHRSKFDIPVVAITGSNGKTTVKEMASAVLSSKYRVLKNEGTKNNHIGVPLTLLKLNEDHQMCVLELGMNHKGEIRTLGGMARPRVAVITNIGPSHIEYFSGLDGIFRAKCEIFEPLERGGTAILNGDDAYLSRVKRTGPRIVRFGVTDVCDFRASSIKASEDGISFLLNGRSRFKLGVIGAHNVYNALAAISVGARFGVGERQMQRALLAFKPFSMRLNVTNINGVSVIDDTYNSNPLSMKCALLALFGYPAGTRWVVAGDMMELGKRSEDYHRQAGRLIASSGAAGLFTYGKLSEAMCREAVSAGMDRSAVFHCSSHGRAAALLKKFVSRGDAVLVKGSRAMRMENVIEIFKGQGR